MRLLVARAFRRPLPPLQLGHHRTGRFTGPANERPGCEDEKVSLAHEGQDFHLL
jgi:hypothetical protein